MINKILHDALGNNPTFQLFYRGSIDQVTLISKITEQNRLLLTR